ncbi:LDB17 [Candida pseudojiufengensis]|uniref:LDB17 n=1 Tax=Candida pseudojiufengensis TaxID=497109 RepID=UPI0022257E2E|nr:LDB17 [Candida pseudojiufengensis]KAI5963540.1 LDB17 [Candida pseudojiufengensis]
MFHIYTSSTNNGNKNQEYKDYNNSKTIQQQRHSSSPNPILRSSTTSFSITSIPEPEQLSTKDYFYEEISTILRISDSQECNENFSIFIKCIIDNIYINNNDITPTYQDLSIISLKLLTSNLFVKNYKFCIAKILAFLATFTTVTKYRLENEISQNDETSEDYNYVEVSEQIGYESECLKEFLCITLLLLLKLKNTSNEIDNNTNDDLASDVSSNASSNTSEAIELINVDEVFKTLQQSRFISIISQFINIQIKAVSQNKSSFVILKFSCDIIFEYLFYFEYLSSKEFIDLTFNNNEIITTIIKDLLSSENFNNYTVTSINGDDDDGYDNDNNNDFNESKLVAYEELKLLLLINEQYLMISYKLEENNKNQVFEELIHNDDKNHKSNVSNIVGFINLLIYHLNREESKIIKLLILKFLYLVFTTSYTSKLIYKNDLKILLDIFLRELDNLDNNELNLISTYLRVLHPILLYSELSECNNYKNQEILNVLSNTIINVNKDNNNESQTISNLASKCMNVKWLKKSIRKKNGSLPNESTNESLSSSEELSNSTTETLKSFTRIASVRSSSRSDYHKHTTVHNQLERKNSEKLLSRKSTKSHTHNKKNSLFMENNNNVFLNQFSKQIDLEEDENDDDEDDNNDPKQESPPNEEDSNILDLPNEYLIQKPLPKLPISEKRKQQIYMNNGNDYNNSNGISSTRNSSSSSLNSINSLKQKAMRKKAPPPPPPPPRRRK